MSTFPLFHSILSWLLFTTSSQPYSGVTYYDLDVTLRNMLITKFERTEFNEHVGHFVRLIFHDCMGQQEGDLEGLIPSICDGCIDVENAAHKGIEAHSIFWLEQQYMDPAYSWFEKLSVADYWAAAATIALQYAAELDSNRIPSEGPNTFSLDWFYIGREDCSEAPRVPIDIDAVPIGYKLPYKNFPEPNSGWEYNANWFATNFDFTSQEYIAALGAHTIGRCQTRFSGFGTAPWTENWNMLDVEFYHDLLNRAGTHPQREWIQTLNTRSGNYQWDGSIEGPTVFVMINADMALVKDIDDKIDETNGECACQTFDDCPSYDSLDERIQTVRDYAGDKTLWLNDFQDVFDKMITMGYNRFDGTLTIIDKYCELQIYSIYIWNVAGSFIDNDENRQLYLMNSLDQFVIDKGSECEGTGIIDHLSYEYEWTYKNKQLTIELIVCCPGGEIFPDGFIPQWP